MINKKGLSTVVTTLIIVTLSLVAVGIVWVVINNIINSGTQTIDYKSKCLDLEVRASAVSCTAGGDCDLTLTKTLGDVAISGVKLVFSNAIGTQGIYYTTDDLNTQEVYTNIDSTLTTQPKKVDVFVYFLDKENKKQVCPGSTTFNDIAVLT